MKQAIIIDIDGTVAEKSPFRDIHDLTQVAHDYPIWATIKVINSLTDKYLPVFVSGRQSVARKATEDWLLQWMPFLPHDSHPGSRVGVPLFMRQDGDNRCDTIIKREIYENHIKDYYGVFCVFDDRKKVIDMWRSLGLFVFDCSQKDNNF